MIIIKTHSITNIQQHTHTQLTSHTRWKKLSITQQPIRVKHQSGLNERCEEREAESDNTHCCVLYTVSMLHNTVVEMCTIHLQCDQWTRSDTISFCLDYLNVHVTENCILKVKKVINC